MILAILLIAGTLLYNERDMLFKSDSISLENTSAEILSKIKVYVTIDMPTKVEYHRGEWKTNLSEPILVFDGKKSYDFPKHYHVANLYVTTITNFTTSISLFQKKSRRMCLNTY